MLFCQRMTGGTSELPDDVAFDHDAAFRASWAIDETLRALDDLADARARLAAVSLCSCSGPYAEALGDDVAGASPSASRLAEALRWARARIAAARDEAFVEQARAEVRRAMEVAGAAATVVPSGAAPSIPPVGSW